jgi:hypothetical protein
MDDNRFIIKESSDNSIYLPKPLMDKAQTMGLFEDGNILNLYDMKLLFGD